MKSKHFFPHCSLLFALLLASCSISYKFTGTSINYDVVKTISVDKFPIRSSYVWAPMESMFYNSIVDEYSQ
ncbi:MAG: hypothetical protein IJM84_01750, partial [Bacteroidaceae bacterium]|nr:hypothetical protein [Bacteroidaceae bacterium]